VYLQHRLDLLYQKFLKKSNHSAPPPCRETALPRRKTFFTIFDFARATNFSAWLCAQPRGAAGLRTLVSGGIFTS